MFSSDTDRGGSSAPVHAFQTDPSWYDAYWYSKPAPWRPSSFNSRVAGLIGMFPRLRASFGKFAEILHSDQRRDRGAGDAAEDLFKLTRLGPSTPPKVRKLADLNPYCSPRCMVLHSRVTGRLH